VFKLLNNDLKAYAFIIITASLLFIPFIGNMPLFDWDEINFAECAREMLVSDNYSNVQLYFQPFWEKPPLFIWLQAISMNLFGINEFAARFPNAICGVITLLVLYSTGKRLNDRRFGLTWSFVYAATLLPHLFFKSGIIDPWFNLFIFGSVFYLIQHTNNPVGREGYKTAIIAGFFLGLALLTKGPAALLLVGLTVAVFFILARFKKISEIKFVLVFFLAFLVTGFSWFGIELLKGNGYIIKEFIDYQVRLFQTEDADHGGPFIYHFIVLLIGCFPSSLLLILAHKRSAQDTPYQKHSKRWMIILFWVVLILFSIVKTKIVHYSSLCYFPLTYLATYSIQKLMSGEFAWRKWLHVFFIVVTSLMGLAFILVSCIPFFKDWLIGSNLIADQFAVENLKADVYWTGFEWLIGLVFLVVLLISIFKIRAGKFKFLYVLFSGSLFTVYSLIMVIAPKIEQYSQHAAIEFYKVCAKNGYDVETISFKSYASLFYGNLTPKIMNDPGFKAYAIKRLVELRQEGETKNAVVYTGLIHTNWLEVGDIKTPGFFVSKVTSVDEIRERHPGLKELYRQNGFVFFIRMPEKK
jgi:4-amino-4-deoxy-L-arabinose transferase-like glycosyltransferase